MKKKDSSSEDEKDDKGDKRKSLFGRRLIAFMIDYLIVTSVSLLISIPFLDLNKYNYLSENMIEVVNDYYNHEIGVNEYVADFNNISYDLAQTSGILTIINIFVMIIYYVIYLIKKNGQTIGKRLMKIKIVSTNGELSINQLIFRSFIANFVLLKILDFSFMIFVSRNVYFECLGAFQEIQFFITFVSIILILFGKEGLTLHDRLVHTKVVSE